ncbi:uncharacterized protein CLUP02_08996 [Colletotrichum lupini]|uniref:Uncharacterized protein n=1 Tax=Colletotrichum lupini TaxID=145971 RepID=A0A9Q8SVC8_9PEZI|nr:uncharacterized protein CLUP02_08996 [Colletotrichum lupini]UQC83501.1 hypothetical protein CLUP02_08996 [Colletotrichum lupini]
MLLDVGEVVEEDDDLVKVENVEALDELSNVLSAALAEELEEELEEELIDDVEDDEVTAVLEEELPELEESEDDVDILVVDVDELVVDAKLAALTVTLEDEVLEGMLLELLLLLVEELLLVTLLLLLPVLLVVGTRAAGLIVTLVDEYAEVRDILLVVKILAVELVAELLVVALLDVESRLAWFAVGEAVELLGEPLEELLEVLLRDAVLNIELLVVEVLVMELIVDNRVASLTVALEEVGDELTAEPLDDGVVVVPLLVDTEIEELAEVGDVELVDELLLVDALLVVDTNEAASTVGLEEDEVPVDKLLENLLVFVEVMLLFGAELKELAVVLDDELMTETLLVGVPIVEVDIKVAALTIGLDKLDEDNVVPTEELLVALGEELVVALEDETVERLLIDALLVVDRSVAALTVGLDEEDKEGEEDVLERLLVEIVVLLVGITVDELSDELEEGEELTAELLEGAAVELMLGDSNVAGLTVAMMEEVVLGTVLLIVEPKLDVELEDDNGLLAEVLEGDPAALLVAGSSVAALAVGLSDAKLLSELLLDAVPLEVKLELTAVTAELEDGEELLLVAAFVVGLAGDDVLEVIDEELLGGVEILLDVDADEAGLEESVDEELPKRPLEDDVGWETGLLIDDVEEAKTELEELELWPAEVLLDVESNVAAFEVGVVEEESLNKRPDAICVDDMFAVADKP